MTKYLLLIANADYREIEEEFYAICRDADNGEYEETLAAFQTESELLDFAHGTGLKFDNVHRVN